MRVAGATFLITGGASLIGSHVAEALLDAGAAEVRVLDNLSFDNAGALDRLRGRAGLHFSRGDVLRTADVLTAAAGVDGVFHGAALITQPLAQQPESGLDVNVRGTAVVLAAAAHAEVSKVVLMSSVSVYGNTAGADINEDMPFATAGLGWPSQLYGGSKLLAEGLCRSYADAHGLPWVALRSPSVYGPYQHVRGMSASRLVEIWRLLVDDAAPVLPVDPDEAHDYVYVADVAAAAVAAFGSGVSGTAINVASGESVTFAKVVEVLADITGTKHPVRFAPASGGVQLTTSAELSYRIERARLLLGWEPTTPLEEGLRRLADWLEAGRAEKRDWAEHGTGSAA